MARITAALDAAGARDIFPFAAPLGGDDIGLPRPISSGSLGVRAHSSISRSGSSLGLSSVGGRIGASTAPILSTASAMPWPGRPGLHLVDQHRHRLAPDFGRDLIGDRLVGDDLGAALGEREIEEDAGAAARLQLAAGAEQFDRAAVDAAALGPARGQRHAQRLLGEDQADDQEGAGELGEQVEHHQRRGSSSAFQPRSEAGRPVDPALRRERPGRRARAASPAPHNGARRRDRRRSAAATMVTISPSLSRSALATAAVTRAWSSSLRCCITILPTRRRRRTSRRRREKPPPPPPHEPPPPPHEPPPPPPPPACCRAPCRRASSRGRCRRRPRPAPRSRRRAGRDSARPAGRAEDGRTMKSEHGDPEDERHDRAAAAAAALASLRSRPAAASARCSAASGGAWSCSMIASAPAMMPPA